MKKAIVIGGGVSGLSIAARLLYKGFNVEIYEKNKHIGGKTNFLTLGDFRFDLTASLIMMPNDYIQVFTDCNKNFKDYFTIKPINTLYKVFYYDGTYYDFKTSLPQLCKTIDNISYNDIASTYGYFKFISSNYKKYLLSEKYFLNKPFINNLDFFNPLTLNKASKLHTLTSCYKDCSKYIKNDKLKNYCLFQSMYVGVSPYSSPNIYNLIPAVTQYKGLYYIQGGMYAYVKALEKLVLDLGGSINTSSAVKEIIFNNKKAVGVKVKNRTKFSDIVVCSTDYSYAMSKLISSKKIEPFKTDINNFKYSCSTFILYLALDKKYPVLNIHNIYINKDFKKNLEAPFYNKLSKDPSLYIYCPSSIDNSLCPKNCETINVMVRVPNLLSKDIVWNTSTIKNIEKSIFKILCGIKGLEDIKSHIVYKSYLTPEDFKNTYNTYYGSAFGISHNLNQSLIFRPQYSIPKIHNLYFTGASIHPGNGISMVLKSSKICADSIKN